MSIMGIEYGLNLIDSFGLKTDCLEEAKRRASELDNGVVKAIPADEVMAKANALLKSMNAV